MTGFALLVTAVLVTGYGVAMGSWRRLDGHVDAGLCERLLAGATVGVGMWMAVSWTLAITHTLTRGTLYAAALAFLAFAAWLGWREREWLATVQLPDATARALMPLVPLGCWSLYALWRGSVLPPASHDVLAYHLPRAVMMVRARGFAWFDAHDPRINNFPANYELLLADVLAMSGSDRLTEWLGTVGFLLMVLAAAALAERWWRGESHALLVAIFTAATPVLLLHSSADKNDVMTHLFAATAVLWGARWCVHGGRMTMVLLIVSLVLGGGTKPNVAANFVALIPFLLLRLPKLRVRDVAITGVFALAFFAVGGGAAYWLQAVQTGGPIGVTAGSVKVGNGSAIAYGDFENLWKVPLLLLIAPFSPRQDAVWVPWANEYWFWPEYEVFFSNFGVQLSLLAIAIPFVAWRHRGSRERTIGLITSILAAAIMLPMQVRPLGFYGAFTRYLLFLVPIVVAFALPPLVRLVRVRVATAAIVALFVVQGYITTSHDVFAPPEYVLWCNENRGTRRVWFQGNRAASVVDRMAGPRDTIAVDGSFDTWVYPAYGAELSRNVVHVPRGTTLVPTSAQWVIIDRSWSTIWGHPDMTDMGEFWNYIGRGTPPPEDVRMLEALMRDRRFRLVFRDRGMNQAVFWRVGSTKKVPPPPQIL